MSKKMKMIDGASGVEDVAAVIAAADGAEHAVKASWLPQRYAVAKWSVAQLELTVTGDDGKESPVWSTQRELADALGIDKSVITHMKKVVGKYPRSLPKKAGETWEAVLQSAYGKGSKGSDGGKPKSLQTLAVEAGGRLKTGAEITAVVKALLVTDVPLTARQREAIKAAAAAL